MKNPAVAKTRHTPLGELLVRVGALTEDDLHAALAYKKERGMKLGQALIELRLVTEAIIAEALRQQGRIHCINLTPAIVDHEIAMELGEERSRQLQAVAINRICGVTTVVMEDPSDVYTVDEIALFLKTAVLAVHAEPSLIGTCIDEVFNVKKSQTDALAEIAQTVESGTSSVEFNLAPDEDDVTSGSEDLEQPVISMIRKILEEGYEARASDIHLEARANAFVIRFRVDGSLFDRLTLPKGWARPALARLKVIANLDIAQRRLPQDGRTQIDIGSRKIDLRLATTPSLTGESAVIRILDGGRELRDLESLDLDPLQLEALKRMTECSDGMVLATGPTGSGKTTTLYAMLKKVHKPDTKIITLEDPVENQMDGITQINANPKAGLTFAKGLRSILRQDPDVVLVGEIRDEETAEIAVQAALTGHLVLSTLHTVGAAETITRLADMNVEPYLLADTLRGVISQRLVRRMCQHCRVPVDPSPEMCERLGITRDDAVVFYEGRGCKQCHGTGYKGRCGLYEIMRMSSEMREIVSAGKSTEELNRAAREAGLITLRDDGLRKARSGQTTLSEVLSVTTRG
ncbi:MAG: Flp pilus assembly complex ATPase component TadA [Planctomycetes bacterium]|nr:Flp pilus assembly complex ATPase component TadA [Planctomycetota bacterium]